jgi:hypothetical protein
MLSGTKQGQQMKLLPTAILILALCTSAAQAQSTGTPGEASAKPISITANFQIRISVDPSAPITDVTKALAQANQSLGDLADRECDALAAAFKSDCRVVQLNMGANVDESRRNRQQFSNDFVGSQRFVNANLNATFDLSSHVAAPKDAAPAK